MLELDVYWAETRRDGSALWEFFARTHRIGVTGSVVASTSVFTDTLCAEQGQRHSH